MASEVNSTVLAFDFGTRRIGVAVGDASLRHAHPLTVIDEERRDARFAEIARLIAEWAPATLVVGRPLHMDGAPDEATAQAARFANQLRGRFGLQVAEVDERLSSADAASRLAEAGHKGRAGRVHLDSVAAQLILEGYFDAIAHP